MQELKSCHNSTIKISKFVCSMMLNFVNTIYEQMQQNIPIFVMLIKPVQAYADHI